MKTFAMSFCSALALTPTLSRGEWELNPAANLPFSRSPWERIGVRASAPTNLMKAIALAAVATIHPSFAAEPALLLVQSTTLSPVPRAAAPAGPAATAPLSPAAALNLAIEYEARYQAAKATLRAESQALEQARAGLRPNIAFSLNRTFNMLYPGAGRQQDYVSSNTSINLRQPLYRPEVGALVRQAGAEVTRQEAILGVERNRLSLDVATIYLETLRTHAEWQTQQSQQQALDSLVVAAQRALPLGLASASLVQERQAKGAQGMLRVMQARLKRGEALAQLDKLVGQTTAHTVQLVSLPDDGFTWPADAPAPLADWQQRARAQSPEVQAAQATVATAREAISRAEAGKYPTVDLLAGRSRAVSDTFTSVNNRFINNSIGVQVAVPLYDGGRSNAATAQAVAQLDRAQAALEGTQRDVDLQVDVAHQLLAQANQRLQAHQVVVAANQQAITAARQGLARGQQSALDVLEAQSQLQIALLEQRTTRLSLLLAQLRLNALAGDAQWLSLVPLETWLNQPVALER